jgi:hypothetical protein
MNVRGLTNVVPRQRLDYRHHRTHFAPAVPALAN